MSVQLYGDGVHDDTMAIQALLDSGKSVIELPEPEKFYLISHTLKIHSCQELILTRWTTVRLAPKSNVPMLANSDFDKGNQRISIRGGIWDYNNLNQAPNANMVVDELYPGCGPRVLRPADYPKNPVTGTYGHGTVFHPDRYMGLIFRFFNVDQFKLSDVVFKDPVVYATQFSRLTNFTIEHITFDFNEGNPSPNNMDGLHFDGFCRNGYIRDIKGNCYDDLLAFNAEDAVSETPAFGPIENITVDGIFADRCHSAARILSCGSLVSNITIRNVYGTYYRYAIGFTHCFADMPNDGIFGNFSLENLYISKALPLPSDGNKCPDWGLVWGESRTKIGSLAIRGFHRVEQTTPTPSVDIDKGCEVGHLTLENCSLENHLETPVISLRNNGKIDCLRYDGCRMVPAPGKVIDLENNGTIGKTIL